MNPLLIAAQTDVGQRRKDNQDTFICATLWSESSALLAVIDGVGGYAGGDRAAAIAQESIERYMATPNGDPLSMLREAVVFANNQIDTQRQQDPRLSQMCCVLTTALTDVSLSKLYFVHVGDTRLYRYRQGTLQKLTFDHSLVGIQEDANELTEAEAMHHPRRNEILREVGLTAHRVDDPDFLESGTTDFQPGDHLLLCSDGLTDMVTQAQIVAVLAQPLTLDQQVAELIRSANQQGGHDNITVVLASNHPSADGHTGLAGSDESENFPARQPLSSGQPVDSGPTLAERKAPKRSLVGLWTVLGLIFAGVVAGLIWYSAVPSSPSNVTTVTLRPRRNPLPVLSVPVPPSSRLDSLLRAAYRSQDHRLVLPNDTFQLDKPLLLTDSLQSIRGDDRLTVLIPTDTARALVAVRVIRRRLVQVENIVISGFKTGIETSSAGELQLSKVYFRGGGLPIQAAIRQDTFRNTLIRVSVQNGIISPQTPRP